YLDGEKRVVGLALLMLIPFFNFHALKFNANTILLPVWAATTLWFLRSFETRRPLYAALAGLGAAAAMLGKYWSIYLLAGLGLADILAPGAPERRLVTYAFWAPLLLPIPVAFATGTELNPLWTMSAWSLLPLVLLASPLVTLPRLATIRMVGIAILFPLISLA